MTVIYAWPRALRYTAALLDEEHPVTSSRGMFTGRDAVSSAGPRRRIVQVTASSLAAYRDGAGICASLNRLLGGRINLVRMDLPPVNWFAERLPLRSEPMTWTSGGDGLDWTSGGSPLVWFSGPLNSVTVTTHNGFPALAVSGLTPGQLVCRAYDVVRSLASDTTLNGASRAVRTVFADASGNAVIPLHDAVPAGFLSIGGPDSGVFRVTSMSRSAQTVNADFPTAWVLREELPGEIPGGATEVDPWV